MFICYDATTTTTRKKGIKYMKKFKVKSIAKENYYGIDKNLLQVLKYNSDAVGENNIKRSTNLQCH